MGDTDVQRKAERVKALLAGYYGVATEQGEAPATAKGTLATTSTHGTPAPSWQSAADATMDTAPAQHLANMLRTCNLERLMVEHRNTSREIKQLDADMQQLVYENYNKFIAATDTIRTMKGQVEQAVPELSSLTSTMDSVAQRSTTISSKLQTRQDKMSELYRVQALLKKLQAIFDLPKRMRAALEEDVLDTAVSLYAEAQPLLRKYGHRGTFRQISQESDTVAKELSQVLKRRLAERKDDMEGCVLLLRKLGEPDDTLQDRYLAGRVQRLRRILKDAMAVVDVMAAASAAVGAPPGSAAAASTRAAALGARSLLEAPGTWGFTEEGGWPNLRAFVRTFDEKLINAMQETVVNVTRFFIARDLTEAQAAEKRGPLVALARDVFADYFRIVRRALADTVAASVQHAACLQLAADSAQAAEADWSLDAPSLAISSNWGSDTLAQALNTLSTDLSLVAGSMPELGLKDRAAELVSGAVQQHVAACFGALRVRLQGCAAMLKEKLSGQGAGGMSGLADSTVLRKAYAYMAELLSKGLDAVMQGLRGYESHPRLLASCHSQFMAVLQSSLQSLFLDLMTSALSLSGVRYDGSDLLREALKQQSHTHHRASTLAFAPETGSWAVSHQLVTVFPALASIMAHQNASGSVIQPPSSAAHTAAAAAASSQETARSGLVLLLAWLCTHMEQQVVPWVMETLAGSLTAPKGGLPVDPGMAPLFIPGEVARRLAAASSALLGAYVELHGRQLSIMVRRSVGATNWLQHKEPRGPRPVCDLLCERLGRAEAEVVQLVEDTGRRTDTVASTGAFQRNERGFGAGLLLETGAVERNLAKIFSEKVKVFGAPMQLSQAAILGSIAGVGLKSFVECIRLQTLGRAGLQQLQLDCHYLRPMLRRFTGGRTQQVVDSLLGEVVSAGVERCVDPILLEPAVLDRILHSMDAD